MGLQLWRRRGLPLRLATRRVHLHVVHVHGPASAALQAILILPPSCLPVHGLPPARPQYLRSFPLFDFREDEVPQARPLLKPASQECSSWGQPAVGRGSARQRGL